MDWLRLVKCNLADRWRKPDEVFCEGLSGRHCGVCVTLWIGGESPSDFFAKLFWIKKRVFGYFFQKVTLLIKTSLFVLRENSQREFSIDKDSIYVE